MSACRISSALKVRGVYRQRAGVRLLKFFAPALSLALVCTQLTCTSVQAHQETSQVSGIEQSAGVDPRVDYASLTAFGPWDDRNYALTAEDLQYLAPDEHELHDPIPAFFRVELRKEMPNLRRSGQGQYPRSAVSLFERRHGGLRQGALSEKNADGR